MNVVISQPMYFPWVGMFEQIALADVYVHYTDVQFSKGSFTNRVQVKTGRGMRWMTVPLRDHRLGQRIDEVLVDDCKPWRAQHLALLEDALGTLPCWPDARSLFEGQAADGVRTIAEVSIASMMAVCRYFGLDHGRQFLPVEALGIRGQGSQRVLDIVRALGGTRYVTGHGARNYLDHAAFEVAGIEVAYMDYACAPYPQIHGPFTPYVTVLDLIAATGPAGRAAIGSSTRPWREFADERA